MWTESECACRPREKERERGGEIRENSSVGRKVQVRAVLANFTFKRMQSSRIDEHLRRRPTRDALFLFSPTTCSIHNTVASLARRQPAVALINEGVMWRHVDTRFLIGSSPPSPFLSLYIACQGRYYAMSRFRTHRERSARCCVSSSNARNQELELPAAS